MLQWAIFEAWLATPYCGADAASQAGNIRLTDRIDDILATRKSITTLILLLASISTATGLRAQTVNTWVDDDGVTHYSDQKPAGDDTGIKQIEVPEAAVTGFESETVNERINKQLQQLEQDRVAREREAEARKRTKAVEEALEREPIVAGEEKKKKDRDRDYSGPYPKPPPGPFPEQFPRPRGPANPSGPVNPANQGN